MARRLRALWALDACAAGASLRETAAVVLGPGDWPGDGEHRKSLVRRLLVAGAAMVRAGPRAVLAADRTDGFGTADTRHLQIHEHDVLGDRV